MNLLFIEWWFSQRKIHLGSIEITWPFYFTEVVSNYVQLIQFPLELFLMLPYLAVVVLTFVRFDCLKKLQIQKSSSEQLAAK